MEALILIGFIFVILVICLYTNYYRKKEKELTPYERKEQTEEMTKAVEELINEVIQESDYGKKANEEIEQLKSEVKQLQKELTELKKDDHDKQIGKE